MSGRIAIYPGSFDPVTVGHLDIIRRAASMFDRVIVAVLINRSKQGSMPIDMRLDLLQEACKGLENVSIESFGGLLADYAHSKGDAVVIRGLRSAADFESESVMAQINSRLCPGMETVFLTAKAEHVCVSSSVVRELASFGGDYSAFVPESCLEQIKAFYHNI